MFQKKSLGQNFLSSKKALSDIVRAGDIKPGEVVLEAGPGTGNLTEALLSAGAKVIAVEKDRRLIPMLQEKFAKEISTGRLTLVEADILDFDFETYQLSNLTTYKLIANIPYYITGIFIRKFLEAQFQPKTMVLLVQKEVAERIVAKDKKESILSISVKAYGNPHYVETVKAGSFSPAPKVDSAILAVENISRSNFADLDEKRFFEIVKTGFAHKRKQLLGNLKTNFPEITEEKLASLGLNAKIRAENLTLENWWQLLKILGTD